MSPVASPGRGLVLEDLASSSKHCCCAYGNIILTRSLCAPDKPYVHVWSSAITRYSRSYPEGLGIIVFIDANAHPPNEEERDTIKHSFQGLRHIVRGVVQVVEGQGFLAAAMRGALGIVNLASDTGVPIKIASTVAEAKPKLAKLLGPAMNPRIDEAALTQAADEIRTRLKADELLR